MNVRKYDVCPRSSDLEEFLIDIALLKQASLHHTKLLTEHNGYIRQNQAFQNKILGGLIVVGGMSTVAAVFSILSRIQ